jgi:hypothetical protein
MRGAAPAETGMYLLNPKANTSPNIGKHAERPNSPAAQPEEPLVQAHRVRDAGFGGSTRRRDHES